MTANILTIDVEEVFHGEFTRQYRKQFTNFRTPYNIPPILELLKERDVRATFFVVGEIAEKYPEVVKMIVDDGHEVAFHGWSHLPLWKLDSELLRREVIKFKSLHPSCIGFRAPSFSLNNDTKWALKTLKEENFCYDSSVFPTWNPLYGVYKAPQKPYMPSLNDVSKEGNENYGVIEFPLLVYSLLGLKIPIAGGFWLRLLDMGLIEKGIRRLNKHKIPATIYLHNWELDSETPKLELPFLRSFVTYHNIEKSANLLTRILNKFQFTSFGDYIRINRGMFFN